MRCQVSICENFASQQSILVYAYSHGVCGKGHSQVHVELDIELFARAAYLGSAIFPLQRSLWVHRRIDLTEA